MGPFMVEIVFCRVTRRGRKLKKGMNKAGLANTRNDGPSTAFIPPDDTVKITLDLSENGPVFNALDEMMMKMLEDESADRKSRKKGGQAGPGGAEAKKALKSLLKSGIPGIEKMFAPAGKGKKGSAKGFHKMNEGSKKKFMKAIFGEDGTAIETGTAAALIAATCSGGDPEVGDKIAQLLVPELGDKIDPTMMAALMIACSMISAGAGMEEVLKAMKAELLDSGMPEEEIFRKTQLLMQAFGRDESGSLAEYSLAGKQKNSALKRINISPKDFAQIALLQRTLGSCGATPENLAKVIMIQNQLSKRGAQSRHIADALRKLTDPNKGKTDTISTLTKALSEPKLKKEDVQCTVRMIQALDMENEPTWKEVKSMKDILQGASPNSPEAIELNLARATKAAGLNRGELTRVLLAQKTMSVLGIDPTFLSQVVNIEKVIADNGVPAVEIARVLSDGGVPLEAHKKLVEMTIAGMEKDYCGADVDAFLHLYDGMKLKSNVPEETIEHIDKTLIQVRCSLEDVADNLVSSMCARGEKDNVIIRNLCETLKDTGASVQIVGTTMMGTLVKALPKSEPELMKDTGRSLTEVGYNTDDVNSAMTEILLNVLDEKPDMREDAVRACEVVMKDSGQFPDQIRTYLDSVIPEEPPMQNTQLVEELERLRAEDEARNAMGESDGEPEYDESGRIIPKKPKNMAKGIMDRNGSGPSSRRGSYVGTSPRGSISIGGSERRGSFYSEDVSKRDSVAIVVDDPENQKNMEKALNEVFDDESKGGGSTTLSEAKEKLKTLSGKEKAAQMALVEALESSLASEGDSDPLLDIQENLLKSEMEKVAELSGSEKEAQLSKIESLKVGLTSSKSDQLETDSAKGPSWKERLSSLSSIPPSELSIESSLDLIDKEFDKLSSLSGSEKTQTLNQLQDLKRGLLTDLIQQTTSDSDTRTETILRLMDFKEDIPLLQELMSTEGSKDAHGIKVTQSQRESVYRNEQSEVSNRSPSINDSGNLPKNSLSGDQVVDHFRKVISSEPASVNNDGADPLSSLALNLARNTGDINNISPSAASQILSLLNDAVSSDISTSLKPDSNLNDLKSILLSSKSGSGEKHQGVASIPQRELLSKVLGGVMGLKIEATSSTKFSTEAIDESSLPMEKGQLTVEKQRLLADYLKSATNKNEGASSFSQSSQASIRGHQPDGGSQAGEAASAFINKQTSFSGAALQEVQKLIAAEGSLKDEAYSLASQIDAIKSKGGDEMSAPSGYFKSEQGAQNQSPIMDSSKIFVVDGASLNQMDLEDRREYSSSEKMRDSFKSYRQSHPFMDAEASRGREQKGVQVSRSTLHGQDYDGSEFKEASTDRSKTVDTSSQAYSYSHIKGQGSRDFEAESFSESSYGSKEKSRRANYFQDNRPSNIGREASSLFSIDERSNQNDADSRANMRQYIRNSDDMHRSVKREPERSQGRAKDGYGSEASYSRSHDSGDIRSSNFESKPRQVIDNARSNSRIKTETNRWSQVEDFRQDRMTSTTSKEVDPSHNIRQSYASKRGVLPKETIDPNEQFTRPESSSARSRFSESSNVSSPGDRFTSFDPYEASSQGRRIEVLRSGQRGVEGIIEDSDRYSRRSRPVMDSKDVLFSTIMRQATRSGDGSGGTDADMDINLEDEDLLDLDPEKVDEMVSAIQSSGLSEAEIKKLMGVFKLEGKIHHIGGVSKFRTSDNIKNLIMDTEDMFDRALDDAEAQRMAIQKIGVSPETRKLMQKILATQKSSEAMSDRVSNILASTGLTSTKGVDYRKRDDVERVEYSAIKDTNVRRTNRRFDTPDIEPEETYRHPASLGIGVIGTGNQRLVRRNVNRVSRFRVLEESRESSVDDDRRITGLRRAKVPLMVYSCGGFTRCYRIARFYSVDGPPIGLKYRDNPTSGL